MYFALVPALSVYARPLARPCELCIWLGAAFLTDGGVLTALERHLSRSQDQWIKI